jgi:hypothetical protein
MVFRNCGERGGFADLGVLYGCVCGCEGAGLVFVLRRWRW